jgi:hypothetical protein
VLRGTCVLFHTTNVPGRATNYWEGQWGGCLATCFFAPAPIRDAEFLYPSLVHQAPSMPHRITTSGTGAAIRRMWREAYWSVSSSILNISWFWSNQFPSPAPWFSMAEEGICRCCSANPRAEPKLPAQPKSAELVKASG